MVFLKKIDVKNTERRRYQAADSDFPNISGKKRASGYRSPDEIMTVQIYPSLTDPDTKFVHGGLIFPDNSQQSW